jgi:hypothetical protein
MCASSKAAARRMDAARHPEPVLRAICGELILLSKTHVVSGRLIASYIVITKARSRSIGNENPMILTSQGFVHLPLIKITPSGESALSLFVLRVITDNHDSAFSLDHLALLAHRLHRRTNLHWPLLLSVLLLRLKKGAINHPFRDTRLLYSFPKTNAREKSRKYVTFQGLPGRALRII